MITLLAPITGAAASNSFRVGKGSGGHSESRPIAIFMPGIGVSEFGDVQFSHNGGTTWTNLFEDGTQVRLTNTNNAEVMAAPGLFRINKGVTAAAVGVFMSTPTAPV